ncbi:MAG: transposase [Chloroflexota bacterium]|nr:transposase [Chloroflexota bacterium]
MMKHHRHSIRLRGYDYSQDGAYFVTICVQGHECLLGEIVDGQMILNNAGKMVREIWLEIPEHYPGVQIDEFTVMPNHIHGIIIVTTSVGATPSGCPDYPEQADELPGQARGPQQEQMGESTGQAGESKGQARGPAPTGRLSLPDVVHRFKSLTTARYRHGVMQNHWQPFYGKLWQRNYWERIVRNERELNLIRRYIIENPLRWEVDEENPVNIPAKR